jgi:hypothetical protein
MIRIQVSLCPFLFVLHAQVFANGSAQSFYKLHSNTDVCIMFWCACLKRNSKASVIQMTADCSEGSGEASQDAS